MSNSNAFGYENFEGGVTQFSGKSWIGEKSVARTKKVPGYIQLGRSGRHVPWRPFERGFREKIARSEKVARRSKIFRSILAFEGRVVSIAHDPRLT